MKNSRVGRKPQTSKKKTKRTRILAIAFVYESPHSKFEIRLWLLERQYLTLLSYWGIHIPILLKLVKNIDFRKHILNTSQESQSREQDL